jgi:hypothetical protein
MFCKNYDKETKVSFTCLLKIDWQLYCKSSNFHDLLIFATFVVLTKEQILITMEIYTINQTAEQSLNQKQTNNT